MKPAFILIALSFFCFKAFGQTLTLDALADMLIRAENKPYLALNGFALCKDCAYAVSEGSMQPVRYKKNEGWTDEETLGHYNNGTLEYSGADTGAVNKLLQQAKVKFKLTRSGDDDHVGADGRSLDTYIFTNSKLSLSFLIFSNGWIIDIGPEKK